jgi:hypothetical protein
MSGSSGDNSSTPGDGPSSCSVVNVADRLPIGTVRDANRDVGREQNLDAGALGNDPLRVLSELSEIRVVGVVVPTRQGVNTGQKT